MAVTRDDVLHVARLARLAIDESRLASLVAELNGILGHMEALGAVETSLETGDGRLETSATALRPDKGPPIPLAAARETFAPQMADGFFLVPRLATHEDLGSRSP